MEALQRLDPGNDPKATHRAGRTAPRPVDALSPTSAPPDASEVAVKAPPASGAKAPPRKSLVEVLAELEGRDIRLPPPPAAGPPRRPPFVGRPTPSPSPPLPCSPPPAGLGVPPALQRPALQPPLSPGLQAPLTPMAPPGLQAPLTPMAPPGSPSEPEPLPPASLPSGALIGLLAELRSDGEPGPGDGGEAAAGPPPATPGSKRDPDGPSAPISTWPPPGAVAPSRPLEMTGQGVGPLKSSHRLDPRRQHRRRLGSLLSLVLVAGAGAGIWYLKSGPSQAAPATWDPRIAPLAAFVHAHTGLSWVRPLHVDFEPPAAWPNEAGAPSTGVGSGLARWVPSDATLYVGGSSVAGAVPDLYTDLAIVGQLTVAIQAEHRATPNPAPPGAAVVEVQRAFVRSLNPAGRAELAREERRGH